jgi:hypothetical protein
MRTNLSTITECNESDSIICGRGINHRGYKGGCQYCLPSCIVVTIVLSECLTTSSTLSPLLSAGLPVAGSAGIDASVLIEPETSMTQQMSNGARRLTDFSKESGGHGGGETVMRTLLVSGCEDNETERESSVEAAVCDEVVEFGVPGLICMTVG